MPSTRELRRHIKSIRSTRQITKAMEMVATSKMRRASLATLGSRPYALRALEVLRDLTNTPLDELSHPLIDERPVSTSLLIVIASDRGLAGSYNAMILKSAIDFISESQAQGHTIKLITMGKKAEHGLARLDLDIIQSYPHTPIHPTAADVAPISKYVTTAFLNGEFDAIYIAYTHFESMLRQIPNIHRLLPLSIPELAEETAEDKEFSDEEEHAHKSGHRLFIYEPTPAKVLDFVLPRLVDVQLYQALQESLSSEHASRRLAMNNATENAADIIDRLQLTYNSVRQSGITRELAEITSGAAALES